MTGLPNDPQARKSIPLAGGCLDYFPSALVAVAALSAKGNDQHNPGQRLHWDRAKSGDEADALLRHLMQRGTVDTDGILHSTKVAWRALALLQKELEAGGAPLARGARAELKTYADVDRAFNFPEGFTRSIADQYMPPHATADSDDNVGGLKAGEAIA